MGIYSISERYHALRELLEDESIPQDEINAALVEVQDELQAKGENILGYLNRLDGVIAQGEKNKKDLDAYLKVLKNRRKRMIQAVIYAMDTMETKSILTGRGELKKKVCPCAVVVDDASLLPTEYTTTKVDIVPDKKAIKEAIKEGKTVPGAHLEQGVTISY